MPPPRAKPPRVREATLIRGGTILGFDPPGVESADILIQDGVITGRSPGLSPPPAVEIIDATGLLVVPGLVDAWTQLTADPLGGLHADGPARDAADRSLLRAHSEESLICAAFAAGIRALRSGVTGVVEIVDSPALADRALTRVRDVLLTLGLRCVLAPRIGDEDGPEALEGALASAGAAARFGGGETYRMAIATGSLATMPDPALEMVAALARSHGTPVLVEAGVAALEDARCRRTFGASPAERLIRVGLAGPSTVVRAGTGLGAAEMEALRTRGATFVSCPGSDLRHGRSPIPWDAADALGTAEGPPDVLAETQLFRTIAAGRGESAEPARAATLLSGGRRLLGRLSGLIATDLEVGSPADLGLWQAQLSYPLNHATLCHHLLQGFDGATVRSVMVNGRFLLRDGAVLAIDAEDLFHLTRRGALDLWMRLRGSAFPGWIAPGPEPFPEAASDSGAAAAAGHRDARLLPSGTDRPPAPDLVRPGALAGVGTPGTEDADDDDQAFGILDDDDAEAGDSSGDDGFEDSADEDEDEFDASEADGDIDELDAAEDDDDEEDENDDDIHDEDDDESDAHTLVAPSEARPSTRSGPEARSSGREPAPATVGAADDDDDDDDDDGEDDIEGENRAIAWDENDAGFKPEVAGDPDGDGDDSDDGGDDEDGDEDDDDDDDDDDDAARDNEDRDLPGRGRFGDGVFS